MMPLCQKVALPNGCGGEREHDDERADGRGQVADAVARERREQGPPSAPQMTINADWRRP